MIRYFILTSFVMTICIWSFRDWYKALCALIPMLAIMERPDMPRALFGISGFNLYNLALLCIMTAFLGDRASRALGRLPTGLLFLFICYLTLMAISTARMFWDFGVFHQFYEILGITSPSTGELIIDNVADPVRFMIPGLLLSAGFQNRERALWGVYSILIMGALFSAQVIIKMAPALFDGQDLGDRALRVLDRDMGYHRVAASSVLGMIVPAYFAVYLCKSTLIPKLVPMVGLSMTFLGLALTGGRVGLIAGLGACAVLAMLRNRMMLIWATVILVLAIPLIPGLQERLFSGVSATEHEISEERETRSSGEKLDLITEGGIDLYEVTSGRIAVWPLVLKRIGDSPMFGYGKQAMLRLGVTEEIMSIINMGAARNFTHPHNAYLELVLDHGFIGGLIILCFFLYLTGVALKGYMQNENTPLTLVAAMLLGYLISFAIAGLGSGSFYPQLRTTTMWCLIGLVIALRYRRKTEEVTSNSNGEKNRVNEASSTKPLWEQRRYSPKNQTWTQTLRR